MDNNYKEYSLKNLEKWFIDAISTSEASPEEIFNVIKNCIVDEYNCYKETLSRLEKMSDLLNIDVKSTTKYIYESPDGGKTVYRRKFGQSPSERELVNHDSINSHSEYYYDYTRNDSNRPNPFVPNWTLPVEVDGLTGNCYIEFPDDLLTAANLKEGDTVEWIDNKDGSYLIRKV